MNSSNNHPFVVDSYWADHFARWLPLVSTTGVGYWAGVWWIALEHVPSFLQTAHQRAIFTDAK